MTLPNVSTCLVLAVLLVMGLLLPRGRSPARVMGAFAALLGGLGSVRTAPLIAVGALVTIYVLLMPLMPWHRREGISGGKEPGRL